MGKRLLRATLLRPSNALAEIEARLEAVAEAHGDLRRREELRRAMDGVLDLERLLGRIALDSAGPREVLALAATLGCLPGLKAAVAALYGARVGSELGGSMDALEDLHAVDCADDCGGAAGVAGRWRSDSRGRGCGAR